MWIKFLLRRTVALVATVAAASAIVFFAVSLSPGDPAVLLSGTTRPTPEMLAAVRAEHHLDQPVWVQYGLWLQGILTGNPGRSFVYNTDVAALVGPRLGNTILLVAYAGMLILMFGVASGAWAALKPRAGRAVLISAAVLIGAPSFVVATLLIWIFATRLGWFPVYGSGEGFPDVIWHLTLPAIALSLSYVAYVSRITSTAVAEELRSEHVETAIVRGIPGRLIVRRHVLRNAAAPILTVAGISIASLFAGSVVVEQAFGLPGVGSLLVTSAASKDVPVVQVIVLALVAVFALVTTLVDVLSAVLDPRLVKDATSR